MPSSEAVRRHVLCRVCSSVLPEPYLDLGEQPLANALVDPSLWTVHDDEPPEVWPQEFTAPLAVALCPTCGLSQLTVVVDPTVLYKDYRFRSGTSSAWVEHCERLAMNAGARGHMLDIAANDGTCMNAFKRRGWRVVGVDPSPCGPDIIQGFWPNVPGTHLLFDLVVAQNVLGHVDDPTAFLTAVEKVLAPDGMCVVEVPHVRDLITHGAFDTIYHEHLSYWNTAALIRCAKRAGLSLHHGEHFPRLHGGTRRYWLKRGEAQLRPALELPIEQRPYDWFAQDVERRLAHIQRQLAQFASEGRKVYGYGASAKAAVMLNALKARGNTDWPVAIVDDAEGKKGLLMPGVHTPIVGSEELAMTESQDVLWLMSWNWAPTLQSKARQAGFRGDFFVTTPTVRVER